MYVFDNGYTPVDKRMLKWHGNEYDKKNVLVVVEGVSYEITNLKCGSETKEICLWNDELKKYKSFRGTFDEVDSKIENVIPKLPEPKEEPIYDSQNDMTLGSGILWYIIIMVGGLIFKDCIIIWIVATIIFVPWVVKKPKFKD